MRKKVAAVAAVVGAVLSLIFVACGGRPAVSTGPTDGDLGVIAGRVFKGAVSASSVTVYRLDATGARGAVAGSATTDADGAFSASVGTSTGPFQVVASGGTFVDEATGVTVQVGSAELTALVPTFDAGTKVDSLRVTPVSHLAAGLALYWAKHEGKTLAAADTEAWQHLNAHFGGLDWRTGTPLDVTAATGATLDDSAKEGLLLAALSMEARLISEADALTPGGRVNALTLVETLFDDLTADGYLDGQGATGALVLPAGGTVADGGGIGATSIDGQAARTAYAQAIAKFLLSDRNVTKATVADAQQTINTIATNADTRIFRGSSGPADVDPPVVTFVKPSQDGSGVHGSVDLQVSASDNVALSSLVFTAPASIATTVATPSADGKSATLSAPLDVSSLADGPLTITVKAIDSSKNETTKSLQLVVSNKGPVITISVPQDGATIKGSVVIMASATAQAGAISKLELRNPPPGVAADTLPAADSFSAAWDTTKALEGPLTLTLHAEDTLGGTTDATVAVTVDNVPFGVVNAVISAGVPVDGLTVQLVAIDDTSGLPVVGRTGGAILGQSTAFTIDGGVSFTLSQENYTGPVQLLAKGAVAQVIDPTDGVTVVSMPSTFVFSSFLPSYTTGAVLSTQATLWTTLADSVALAYASGANGASPTKTSLTSSMAVTDALLTGHVSRPQKWNLRTVRPVSLTNGTPQSLRDTVWAAMPDVALHQLAQDLSVAGGLTPGATINAFSLVGLLQQDIADGLFDGLAASGQLKTPGAPAYSLDANTTRFRLAGALDRFIRGAKNTSTVTRPDAQAAGIFDDMCTSAPPSNPLYPANQATVPFDSAPPTVMWTTTFTNGSLSNVAPVVAGSSQVVAGVVTVTAKASDDSGMKSVVVSVNGIALTPIAGNNTSQYGGTYAPQTSGPFAVVATACDSLNNCGTTTLALVADVTAPGITVAQPTGQFVKSSVPVDASTTDDTGVASFVLSGFSGFTDTDSSVGRVQGTWTVPGGQADGTVTATFTSCDLVGNCATKTATAVVDRTPPSVVTTVKFTNGTVSNASPIGADGAVAGTLAINAVATDPSGVASVQGKMASAALLAGSGSNASTLVSSYVTSSDGAIVLTITACDSVGNCGSPTTALTVDNTAPTIAIAQPVAGYYSQALVLDSTATDAHAVASLAVSGLAGFIDTDSAPTHAAGTWTLPGGVAQGTITFSLASCDVLGNCRTVGSPTGVAIDTAAPLVSAQTAPAQYLNTSTTSVVVQATDATSGVKAVWAKVGGGAPVAAVATPGVCANCWTISGLQLVSGVNTITAWADDHATPANSGAGGSAPQVVTYTTLQDLTPPAPVIRTDLSLQYKDEDAMTLLTDGNGVPLVPAAYAGLGAGRTITNNGMTLKRAATRITSQTNPANRAVLASKVPWISGVDAPITSATWSTTAPHCAYPATTCASKPVYSGVLASVASSAPNENWYELELQLPQDGAYTITETFTDAAGNVGTLNFDLVWQLVGPPVTIVRDTAWEGSSDPQAVHNIHLADHTYPVLFGAGGRFLLNNQMRLARWLIYNPETSPVAVAYQTTSLSRLTTENWKNLQGGLMSLVGYSSWGVDGFTFYQALVATSPARSCKLMQTGTFGDSTLYASYPMQPYPCPIDMTAGHTTTNWVRHLYGNTTTQYECFSSWNRLGATENGAPQGGTIDNLAGTSDSSAALQWISNPAVLGSGNETTTASRGLVGGTFGATVPAATGTTPGVVAVYLAVPVVSHVVAGTSVPLNTGDLPGLAADGSYRYHYADYWDIGGDTIQSPNLHTGFLGENAKTYCADAPTVDVTNWVGTGTAFWWYRSLQTSYTSANIAFNVLTGGNLQSNSDAKGSYSEAWGTPRSNFGGNIGRTVAH